jgi:transposase
MARKRWPDVQKSTASCMIRVSRWAKSGVWAKVFKHLAADADNEYAMIDATLVRAHQHSAGAHKKTAHRRSGAAKAD